MSAQITDEIGVCEYMCVAVMFIVCWIMCEYYFIIYLMLNKLFLLFL